MLILKRDFIKTMIKKVLSYEKENLLDMEEMEESLLIEVGNIMLSSYISALSSLTNIQIHLSVPAVCRQYAGRDLKHAYGNDGN